MPNVLNNFFFIQLIGFAALSIALFVFQVNSRKAMLRLQTTAALLYALHFYLLGAFTGSAMNAAGAVRCYAFYKIPKHTWLLPALFITIFVIACVVTWQGPISLLPMIGMISGTLAFWQQNTKAIRLLALISSPAWFIYSAVLGSYPGMVTEIILLSSNLLGIYRFDIHKALPKRYSTVGVNK